MTIQTFEKVQRHIQVMEFTGGRENGMEICRWVGSGSSYIPSTNTDPFEYVQIPTMFGPRDMEVGNYVVKIEAETFLIYKPEALHAEYKQVTDEEHRLITHARNELSMFPNEDIEFMESIINAVKGFTSYRGHSGASAEMAVHMISALLNGRNLMPLTDDPEEWEFHPKEKYGAEEGLWQNKRNSGAISMDGGKTYFLVYDKQPGEALGDKEQLKFYVSVAHNADEPEIDPEDLKSDDEKEDLSDDALGEANEATVDDGWEFKIDLNLWQKDDLYSRDGGKTSFRAGEEKTNGSDLS